MTKNNLILSLTFMFALLLPAAAAAADWKIVRMSGDVRVFHNNVTWIALKSDYRLKPGDSIWTGRNGRVMLTSEGGRVLLNPRSMVKIPVQPVPGNYSVLFQSMGSVDAEIERRNKRHFSIHTPYLAAVVKGTKFTVSITGEESEVRVHEGTVEAVDKQTGQTLDVRAGEYVGTRHGSVSGMFGTAKGAKSAGKSGGSSGQTGQSGNGAPGNGSSGSAPEGSGTSAGDASGTESSASSSYGSENASSGSTNSASASAGQSEAADGNDDSASDRNYRKKEFRRGKGMGRGRGMGRGIGRGMGRGMGKGMGRGRGNGGNGKRGKSW